MSDKVYAWTVIGAGPGGLTAVGMLLDSGVNGDDILWIDPYFQAGDFGRLWGEVNSNTRVTLFQEYLKSIKSFGYDASAKKFLLDQMDFNGFTKLKAVADPLLLISDQLQKKVNAKKTTVTGLSIASGSWKIHTDKEFFYAEKVILATGAEAKSLNYPGLQTVSMVTALTPSELKKNIHSDDVFAVFGSSHSAMIVIRNLIESGATQIINFYLSPLRYAVLMDDWILYDDTGLKGETAKWVREHVVKKPLSQLSRFLSTPEHIDEQLPQCNKVIYAVGFQQRHIPISGISLAHYDKSNGIIAPGLFGVGIGFPIVVEDPFGRREANVGVWKFYKNLRRTLPLWQRYGL